MTDRIEALTQRTTERTGHGRTPCATRREVRRTGRALDRAVVHEQITLHSAFNFQARCARRPRNGNGHLQSAHGGRRLAPGKAGAGTSRVRLAWESDPGNFVTSLSFFRRSIATVTRLISRRLLFFGCGGRWRFGDADFFHTPRQQLSYLISTQQRNVLAPLINSLSRDPQRRCQTTNRVVELKESVTRLHGRIF